MADALGSTIGLVGSGGTIATNYTYQPFGAATTGGSANGNSYEFTGRENDGTGLYFYRARYYSPTFQRFIANLGNLKYSYDADGRRTATAGSLAAVILPANVTLTTSYNADNEQSTFNRTSLSYDANGNLTLVLSGRTICARSKREGPG